MKTIWLSPTDFVTGDPSLAISYPFASHPGTIITCTQPGDLKWVAMGLRLPENVKIDEIILCYQVANAQSFISQIRLTEMCEPNQALVIHDDPTDLISVVPATHTSNVGGKIPSPGTAVTLALRLNFAGTGPGHQIRLGAVGVKTQPALPAPGCQRCSVDWTREDGTSGHAILGCQSPVPNGVTQEVLVDSEPESNTFFGHEAGHENKSSCAQYNSFFGCRAGHSNTGKTINDGSLVDGYLAPADYNSFFGYEAGKNNQSTKGSFFGYWAGHDNVEGEKNSFFGQEAGYGNVNGNFNSFFGVQAGRAMEGDRNCFFGGYAGDGAVENGKTAGDDNCFFGYQAGYHHQAGNFNTCVGAGSGANRTGGELNAFFGRAAGPALVEGDGNTCLGAHTGTGLESGDHNTYVGHDAGPADGIAQSGSTALGHLAKTTADNQVQIGGPEVTEVRIGGLSVSTIGGPVPWSTPSDGRYKSDVREDVQGLDFIMRLRPVTYLPDRTKLRRDGDAGEDGATNPLATLDARRSGFVAQEVETAASAVGYDFSGVDAPKNEHDFYRLRYAEFVVPLVKAVQEQQAVINAQSQRLRTLEEEIETLKGGLRAIQQQLAGMGTVPMPPVATADNGRH